MGNHLKQFVQTPAPAPATTVTPSWAVMQMYDLGKEAGAEDVPEGRIHDSKCPPNDSISFCTRYKTGYEIGWIAQKTLLN